MVLRQNLVLAHSETILQEPDCNSGCPCANHITQSADLRGNSPSHWYVKNKFTHFNKTFKVARATCEHHSATKSWHQSTRANLMPNKVENFLCSCLNNVSKISTGNRSTPPTGRGSPA